MRAYIHTVSDKPFNEECATAQRGFGKLDIECVPFSSNEVLDVSKREDIVVGGMLVTGHALAMRGVEPPSIDYPDSLSSFLGRKVWKSTIEEIGEDDLPLFVKPANEKELPGIVATRIDDLSEYLARGNGYEVWCSEPVQFVSEWRFFIRYGTITEVRNYSGDRKTWPDWNVVNRIIETYAEAPAGYAIDTGVTSNGRTLLVEINDGYALGCYGADSVAYALLLASRWAELVGVEDKLEKLNSKGFEQGFCEMAVDRGVIRILDHIEGASPSYSGNIVSIAEWMGAIDGLSRYVESNDRSAKDIWRWIAGNQELAIEKGPDGNEYMFPRGFNVRYVVEASSANSWGCSIINRYNAASVIAFIWIHKPLDSDSLLAWLYSRLIGCLEADAIGAGASSIFFIMDDDDDDFPDASFFDERGYYKVPCTEEEDAAGVYWAPGSRVFKMEKRLGHI